MCRHRLDAATVLRPFILPYTSSRLLRSGCSRFERGRRAPLKRFPAELGASSSTQILSLLTRILNLISSADGTTLASQYPKRSEAETLTWPRWHRRRVYSDSCLKQAWIGSRAES